MSRMQLVLSNEVKELNCNAALANCLVTDEDALSLPPVCMEVNGVPIWTLGNISMLIGKAKQGKTFLVSQLIAAALSDNGTTKTLNGCLPSSQRKVIYFDTEQSKYHTQKVRTRIGTIAGKEALAHLSTYALRTYSPDERLQLIEHAIYNTSNLGMVIIDGVRDLVKSINSEEESTFIASKLMKWSEERNIHITTVLHTNKGDNNARGHLGSELTNKAETTLSVSRDERRGVSIVNPEYCRDVEFEPFAFTINENGIPSIEPDFKTIRPSGAGKSKCLDPVDVGIEIHQKILYNALPEFRKSTDFKERLKEELESAFKGKKITNEVRDSFLSFYLSKGFIAYKGRGAWSGYTTLLAA